MKKDAAYGEDKKCVQNLQLESLKGREHLTDLSIYIYMDNTKINFRKTGYVGVDRIHLVQGRDQWHALVNMVMILQVP
jgi:hypothetical protein